MYYISTRSDRFGRLWYVAINGSEIEWLGTNKVDSIRKLKRMSKIGATFKPTTLLKLPKTVLSNPGVNKWIPAHAVRIRKVGGKTLVDILK